jgi:uncharacterized protein (TIGR00251 family)
LIALEPHPEGVILPVRAQPGARCNEVRGEQNGRLKVSVTQIAEKGKANKAILKLLSAALGVRRSQLELLSGETSSEKRILIRQANEQEVRTVIENL